MQGSSERLRQRRSAAPSTPDGVVFRFSAFLAVVAVLLLTAQWSAGPSDGATAAALVVGGAGAWMRAASLPPSAAARPRRPYARRSVLSGWTAVRAGLWVLSAVLLLFAPSACIAVSRAAGSDVLGILVGFPAAAAAIAGLIMNRRGVGTPRLRRAAKSSPGGEPWTRDHPWEAHGESRAFLHYFGSRRMYLGRTCAMYSLLTLPISAPVASDAFVFAVKLALAAGSVWFLWHAWNVVSMGTAFLGFQRFPFHPGERAAFTFGVSAGGAEVRDATLLLRRFTESTDGTGAGSGLPLSTHSIEEVGGTVRRVFAPGVDQQLFFDVPADAPATRIAAAHRSYWEMEVRGTTREGPYEERFLVPVYERPAAPSAATSA